MAIALALPDYPSIIIDNLRGNFQVLTMQGKSCTQVAFDTFHFKVFTKEFLPRLTDTHTKTSFFQNFF